MTRKCRSCKQYRIVQHYISEWQKAFMIPLPFPYCEECAESKAGLTLYKAWITQNRECNAIRSNPELC